MTHLYFPITPEQRVVAARVQISQWRCACRDVEHAMVRCKSKSVTQQKYRPKRCCYDNGVRNNVLQ